MLDQVNYCKMFRLAKKKKTFWNQIIINVTSKENSLQNITLTWSNIILMGMWKFSLSTYSYFLQFQNYPLTWMCNVLTLLAGWLIGIRYSGIHWNDKQLCMKKTPIISTNFVTYFFKISWLLILKSTEKTQGWGVNSSSRRGSKVVRFERSCKGKRGVEGFIHSVWKEIQTMKHLSHLFA